MTLREALIAEARSYMTGAGTRWVHQGRLKHVGVDCIGLIGMSALACGIAGAREWKDDASLHRYGPTPNPELLYGGCERFLDRIALQDAIAGDVYVMAFSRNPQHFAMITRLDPAYLIHAYTSVRKVAENGADVARARVLRAYRFRGLPA